MYLGNKVAYKELERLSNLYGSREYRRIQYDWSAVCGPKWSSVRFFVASLFLHISSIVVMPILILNSGTVGKLNISDRNWPTAIVWTYLGTLGLKPGISLSSVLHNEF